MRNTPAARYRGAPPRSRPPHAGDIAQARLFDDILSAEIADLEQLAQSAEARWMRRCEGDGLVGRPDMLKSLHERIAEARRLLRTLRTRFPDD